MLIEAALISVCYSCRHVECSCIECYRCVLYVVAVVVIVVLIVVVEVDFKCMIIIISE